ncbi:MAG TPA: hypothetical protein VKA46_25975 [Gemmataceae bacterium]|nr:hypothetical protein [Gemmataceae bacterium]
MKESQYIKGWLNEGESKGLVKARRADLLTVLSERIPDPVPEELRLAVEGTNDLDTLQRWLRAAARSHSWADFREAMKNGS